MTKRTNCCSSVTKTYRDILVDCKVGELGEEKWKIDDGDDDDHDHHGEFGA